MVSKSQSVSMAEELWPKIEEYRKEHDFSTDSSVIQLAVKQLLGKKKKYNSIDLILLCLISVVILLLVYAVWW